MQGWKQPRLEASSTMSCMALFEADPCGLQLYLRLTDTLEREKIGPSERSDKTKILHYSATPRTHMCFSSPSLLPACIESNPQTRQQALQNQLYGGQPSPWNFGAAYRIPDTNINLSATYQQGKANLQVRARAPIALLFFSFLACLSYFVVISPFSIEKWLIGWPQFRQDLPERIHQQNAIIIATGSKLALRCLFQDSPLVDQRLALCVSLNTQSRACCSWLVF